MTRVFHIISRLDVGGAESVAINIARHQGKDVEQHIVELQRGCSPFTTSLIRDLEQAHIPCHRSCLPVKWHMHYYADRLVSLLFPLRLLWLWLRYRPDIIHSHTEMPDMAVWWALRVFPFIRVRVVRTIHNTRLWSGMGFIGRRVERFMQSRNANIAISEGVQRAYVAEYGGTPPPIIYNGVRVPALRLHVRTPRNPVHILFAGRFEQQKGIDTLCDIICQLQDDDRYFFHVHGSGRLQTVVDSRLRGLRNVETGAPIANLADKMGDFDYLIMPSLHEGLSILAIEASMNGLPLMINHCAGLSDTLPPDWPLAVNNNDLAGWLHLFNDVLPTADRASLITQARSFAERRFALTTMQTEYVKLYTT